MYLVHFGQNGMPGVTDAGEKPAQCLDSLIRKLGTEKRKSKVDTTVSKVPCELLRRYHDRQLTPCTSAEPSGSTGK